MDIIRRYVADINDFSDKQKGCQRLITDFIENYWSIIYESESLFISKYFMSAILAFCADIDFRNDESLEQFIRFFVEKQTGIWDIWSVHGFEQKQWMSIESCLGIELKNLRHKTGFYAIKYIMEVSNRLNIEFFDPNDKNVRIRFIDFPRFDSIQSSSELWRNIHLPIVDCTLLPESPQLLQLLLQFGAKMPSPNYQIQYIINRINHFNSTPKTVNLLIRKLFWIKFVTIDTPFQSVLYKELQIIANKIIDELKIEYSLNANHCVLDIIPNIPTLKQIVRYYIRNIFRANNCLPDSIHFLEIDPISKQYLNLIYL